MNVSFQGFGEGIATFEASGEINPGVPVRMEKNGVVAACANGEVPCGISIRARDGFVSVLLKGYARVKCGSSVLIGRQNIVADVSGKIKKADTGLPVLVVDVEDDSCGLIL